MNNWNGLPEKAHEDGYHWLLYTTNGIQKEVIVYWDSNSKTYRFQDNRILTDSQIINFASYICKVIPPSLIKIIIEEAEKRGGNNTLEDK